jgi:3-oxoacyl-[acyl-carrier-protein] synthase II
MNRRPRVVVTGLGALTALGLTAEATWRGLVAGRSGIGPSTRLPNDPPVPVAEINDFDPLEFLDAREARRMARFSQLAVAAARQALADAGLEVAAEREERAGVLIGTGVGGFIEVERTAQELAAGQRVSPFFLNAQMANAAAANVSRLFRLRGYSSTILTTCAAGAQAIGEAAEVIRRGGADLMLAGGTEAPISPLGLAAFAATRGYTSRTSDWASACRPFDRDRDGIVGGEGAAVLVLERLEHARARGARIYAELLGYGTSSDAYHLAAPDPTGRGEVLAMRRALADAGLTPDAVDYVNAHATGTPLGDAVEAKAIGVVFGGRRLPVSATKSMLSHTLGAAGAIAAVVCCLTIRDQVIHPTINYQMPDPECDVDCVPNVARPARVRVALLNAFGMGGQNVSLVLGACPT